MATVITSITGLQNLPNLQNFNADYNALQTVDFSGLTNLVYVDISDCDQISTGEPSLTSINVTGCTSLQTLRIDGSDFSAGIPDLTTLTSLQYFDMDRCFISGDIDISSSTLNNLTGFDFYGNAGITSVQLPEAPLTEVNLGDTALTETAVNNILQWLNGSQVENGYVSLEGGTSAVPTEYGLIAKTSLQNKGWNVYVNQSPPARVGIAASSDFDIVGDFTIEMFVNLSNLDGFPRPYSFGAYPAPNAMSIEGGSLYFWANNGALANGAFNPTLGEWNHICVMGTGAVVSLYINGVMITTANYSGSISSQSLPLTIGYGNESSSGFNGLMSNFRWTSNAVYNLPGFAVPTSPLTNVAGTKLLIFQGTDLSAQVTDNSGNGHNATNSGATYSTLSPFAGVQGSLQMGNI
jgi:hypothetical protein